MEKEQNFGTEFAGLHIFVRISWFISIFIYLFATLVMSRTPFYRTSNELERVRLLVIELEHLIFGFERTNIERRT